MSSGCGDVLSLADLQIAKKHQIFEAEVITGKSGGVAGGADIDYATNAVTGQAQKTLPAVLRDAGFSPVSWDFSTGGTLTVNDRDKVVYDPVSKTWYSYLGTLPVTVPAGFNPVGNADWRPQTDPDLRTELGSAQGADMIGLPQGGTVAQGVDVVTPAMFGAIGDGVADDSVAIQAAMDYCQINNRKLVIPSRRYRITKPLLYRNQGFYNYEIEGHGGAAVLIMDSLEKTGITAPDAFGDDFNVNAAMVVLNDTNQSKYCRISGLRFESPVGAEYAIYVGQTENSYIHDCFFTGFTFGWYDIGSWICRIERCVARSIVDTGFFKKTGTSTNISECYADQMERGYYLGGGYSSIVNCACDKTTRWGYYFKGGPAGTDLATFSMKGCGSEQSGADSVFYVDGLVSLSIEDHNAFNDPSLSAAPAALLSMASNTSYSQVVLKNIRTVNVDTLILDAADHNYFDLTNVTCRSAMSKEFYLGVIQEF
ncbi:tailspike [Escherichia phage CR01]|nr:tailspike [Escherichia phage CR01]